MKNTSDSLKVEYAYLSQAASFFAGRQTEVTTEGQAHRILARMGSYNAGYAEKFPYPPPYGEAQHSAKTLLYMHRLNEYDSLLQELLDAGSINLYDPGTLLQICDSAEIKDPYINVDEVGKQLIEFARVNAEGKDRKPRQSEEASQRGAPNPTGQTTSPDRDNPPWKLPNTSIGKLAVKAAWQIELEKQNRATTKEVMARLLNWADDEKAAYADRLEKNPPGRRGVWWYTSRGAVKEYTILACEKTLTRWNESRTKTTP